MWEWFVAWSGWLGAASVLMFIVSLWLVSWLIIRLPSDYFLTHDHGLRPSNRILYVAILVINNALGALLIASGIAMLILPGQGILTILLGLTLVSFPGKPHVTRWILARHRLRKAINWIRTKAHRPPLQFEEE